MFCLELIFVVRLTANKEKLKRVMKKNLNYIREYVIRNNRSVFQSSLDFLGWYKPSSIKCAYKSVWHILSSYISATRIFSRNSYNNVQSIYISISVS